MKSQSLPHIGQKPKPCYCKEKPYDIVGFRFDVGHQLELLWSLPTNIIIENFCFLVIDSLVGQPS
jgi:hypothetical protein